MSAFTPLVTVVVPSFNEDPHIVRASLESIRAQTFADFECIVVDESSAPSWRKLAVPSAPKTPASYTSIRRNAWACPRA